MRNRRADLPLHARQSRVVRGKTGPRDRGRRGNRAGRGLSTSAAYLVPDRAPRRDRVGLALVPALVVVRGLQRDRRDPIRRRPVADRHRHGGSGHVRGDVGAQSPGASHRPLVRRRGRPARRQRREQRRPRRGSRRRGGAAPRAHRGRLRPDLSRHLARGLVHPRCGRTAVPAGDRASADDRRGG
jgi:hypothetical protein